jgi:Putative inner membrane exporter, YdcZ
LALLPRQLEVIQIAIAPCLSQRCAPIIEPAVKLPLALLSYIPCSSRMWGCHDPTALPHANNDCTEVTIMQFLLVLLVLVAGASIAVQPVINATAAAEMGHPLWRALVSAAVTFLALAATIAAIRLPLPTRTASPSRTAA